MGANKAEIVERAQALNVRFVRLQFTDILGVLKNVAIPVDALPDALDGKVMFDGSSIEGFVRVEEYDLFLDPDPDTFAVFPWKPKEGTTARLMCDIKNPDGSPFPGCPRSALRRVLDEARQMGYEVTIGVEPEFFLFQQDANGQATTRPIDQAGYFDLSPVDLGEDARREMVLTLQQMGFRIDATHHEVAPSQHEIDLAFTDALSAADNIATFRFVVRTIARLHGLHATFMPKPIYGLNGSGLHLFHILWADGKNAFYDARQPQGLSRVALHFIAGLMRHAPAITAVTNPLVNSYKRLVPGYEAPVYIAWSSGNRSPMIRVPAHQGADTRIELRSPDPACNPYLALAVTIKAGLDGVRHRWEAPPPITGNVYRMSESERRQLGIQHLPGSLEEALKCLEQDPVVLAALGPEIAEWYLEAKRIEWDIYRRQVHPWEIEQYLNEY
ncbi:MAG: type I glutamate--ammonia ligase [Firmicutes bacterium]|nr:type I glutamate--ammonia ligase [Alicyclobacillaceae bacterium]MCL6498042.1 type I glutamate--ammonia ligase [Bacillota bacterium]